MKQPKLSIIVPFYNESRNLPVLHKQIINVIKKAHIKSELIYVDDKSSDRSSHLLKNSTAKYKSRNCATYLLSLEKRSGQTAASSFGIIASRGKYIAFLDADLQNDPRDIPKMYNKIITGYDAVFGWRKNRRDNLPRTIASFVANLIIRKLFKVPVHDLGCSIKIVKKQVISEVEFMSEYHRLLPAIIYWNGARIHEMPVNHRKRKYGESKYGYMRIFKLIIDLTTIKFLDSYRNKPSYVFAGFGMLTMLSGIITFTLVVYRKFAFDSFIHRDPLFLVAIFLTLISIQFILMGLLAELVIRASNGESRQFLKTMPKAKRI